MKTLASVRKGKRRSGLTRLACASLIATVGVAACHSDRGAELPTSGASAERGRQRIEAYGCGSCHMIPGIGDATGLVGPSLENFGRRTFIAGRLPNSRANLVRWIMKPQSVAPGNAMPNLGINERDARDISAYLYTLR